MISKSDKEKILWWTKKLFEANGVLNPVIPEIIGDVDLSDEHLTDILPDFVDTEYTPYVPKPVLPDPK
jgi:hypothetical protein